MTIVYYSKTFFADCDFPLIKEMQNSNVDVKYYLCIPKNFKAESILEFDGKFGKFGFYKASKLKQFQKYRDCVDLERLFIIAPGFNQLFFFPALFVWIYAILHMLSQKADIFHITYHLRYYEKLLLKIPIASKKVMTVHDPFSHSGKDCNVEIEKSRKKCFDWADKLILLNKQQHKEFCNHYDISFEKLAFSKLGAYNSISYIHTNNISTDSSYILYFGLITPYKGIEYLLNAMIRVHKIFPELKLIVAGKGEFYFDIKPFEKLDYIEFRHRYIGIDELIQLVRNAEFSVCPYKDATQSGVIQTAYTLDCPVIATNVGALPEVVIEGKTGYIVPPCDEDALVRAILDLHKDEKLRNQMKEYIKTQMSESMSWKPISLEYFNIYNCLV